MIFNNHAINYNCCNLEKMENSNINHDPI